MKHIHWSLLILIVLITYNYSQDIALERDVTFERPENFTTDSLYSAFSSTGNCLKHEQFNCKNQSINDAYVSTRVNEDAIILREMNTGCNGYFGLFHLFSGCLNGIYDVYRKVLQDDRTT